MTQIGRVHRFILRTLLYRINIIHNGRRKQLKFKLLALRLTQLMSCVIRALIIIIILFFIGVLLPGIGLNEDLSVMVMLDITYTYIA